jgi:hypothetical protein
MMVMSGLVAGSQFEFEEEQINASYTDGQQSQDHKSQEFGTRFSLPLEPAVGSLWVALPPLAAPHFDRWHGAIR